MRSGIPSCSRAGCEERYEPPTAGTYPDWERPCNGQRPHTSQTWNVGSAHRPRRRAGEYDARGRFPGDRRSRLNLQVVADARRSPRAGTARERDPLRGHQDGLLLARPRPGAARDRRHRHRRDRLPRLLHLLPRGRAAGAARGLAALLEASSASSGSASTRASPAGWRGRRRRSSSARTRWPTRG